MMSTVLAFLGSKLGLALLGGGSLLAGMFGPKLVSKMVAGQFGKVLAKAYDLKTDDPVKKQLVKDAVLANVKLAEYCIPDRGRGEDRKKMVQAFFERFIPARQAEVLSVLIEEAVATMDDELKKAAKP